MRATPDPRDVLSALARSAFTSTAGGARDLGEDDRHIRQSVSTSRRIGLTGVAGGSGTSATAAAVASVLVALGTAASGATAARITVGACVPKPFVARGSAARFVAGDADPLALGTLVAEEVLGAAGGSQATQYHRELVKALTRQSLSGVATTVGS